ncbi:hypothetical protein M9Y10_001516 [Tritrichomonas musculus]|uniref:Uncharacterized protein n=1 Tax=Tritrichomonas musculus TaxID=1915356 RepID=A0ABR2L889_9EUKA
MEIPIGQIGDHIDYDGPIYNDNKEEVGTFRYEIDFLPLEYSAEIEDKYRREMEKIEKEEEKQKEEKREEEEIRSGLVNIMKHNFLV